MRLGPGGAPQLGSVVPLPPGRLLALAAKDTRLRLLAMRAAVAWCQPGRPGFGALELNGGWRCKTLQELQAAATGTAWRQPTSQASAPAAFAPWDGPRRPCCGLASTAAAAPAESTCSRPSCRGGGVQQPLGSAASSAACQAMRSSPVQQQQYCQAQRPEQQEEAEEEEEEVSSHACKRRRLAPAPAARPAPLPLPQPCRAAAAGAAPPISAQLPQFSNDEVLLLEECLLLATPHAADVLPHPACSVGGRPAAPSVATSAVGSLRVA